MPPETASETDVLGRVVQWAEGNPLVRAVVLESSRAVGQAAIDRFSDYDILLVVSDVRSFADDDAWQRYFAEPLVRFGDAFDVLGCKVYMRLVLYQDHTKIDYAIWPSAGVVDLDLLILRERACHRDRRSLHRHEV